MEHDGRDPRRRRHPFDDFFDFEDIDREFERMRRYMDSIFSEALERKDSDLLGKPFVYGFSMRVGPDGRPQIQEFGNTQPPSAGMQDNSVPRLGREPMTDVIETAETVCITAEMPGVEKREIDLRLTEETVIINVDNPDHRYYKEVVLPTKIEPESAKATCKNGILDISFTKQKKPETPGRRIDID